MEENGYQEKQYWNEEGWNWRMENDLVAPGYWRSDSNGTWYGVSSNGPFILPGNNPVTGISYHEACAFSSWAGARLPYEHEWEAAKNLDLLEETGRVWEWCQNTFYPYDGFVAFPYDGYSIPYFDGKHYTLRGGSAHTQPVIKRSSFRNYYLPDKRFIFAGLRLVYQ